MNDRVWTVEDGAARIGLNDDSELRLNSAAEVAIDSFVYDPERNAGGAATRIFTA